MFGVGTDYCLLLLSRYREELRRFEDKHDAMRPRAVQRAGPAILASGLTVSLAMLVLLARRHAVDAARWARSRRSASACACSPG